MCNCLHTRRVHSDMTTPLALVLGPLWRTRSLLHCHQPLWSDVTFGSPLHFQVLHVRLWSKCPSLRSGVAYNYTVWKQSSGGWLTRSSQSAIMMRALSRASHPQWGATSRAPRDHLDRRLCIIHWPLFTEPFFMGKHAPRRWNTPGVVYYRWYRVSGPRGGSVKCRVISYKRHKLCCVALKSCCMESMQIKCCAKKILLYFFFSLWWLCRLYSVQHALLLFLLIRSQKAGWIWLMKAVLGLDSACLCPYLTPSWTPMYHWPLLVESCLFHL